MVVTIGRTALDVNVDVTTVDGADVEGADCMEVMVGLVSLGVGEVVDMTGLELAGLLVVGVVGVDFGDVGETEDGELDGVVVVPDGLEDDPVAPGVVEGVVVCRLCKASSVLSANAAGRSTSTSSIKRIDTDEQRIIAGWKVLTTTTDDDD
jgi:hypothetical protein